MAMPEVAQVIQVPGLNYDIVVGRRDILDISSLIKRVVVADRAVVVTDDVVGPLYARSVVESLNNVGMEAVLISVPPGDSSKSMAQAGRLFDALAERQHGRDEPIVAVGGGVVGDLAGFVAATWHRGVPWIPCPTTLEADIDASIGGKTAVNHPSGKNLIGAFHQPALVCIDIDCLDTLSGRDYTAALAESVKHAVIHASDFFDWHEQNAALIVQRDPGVVEELVARNCRIKAEVVAADMRETASRNVGRAALNFGHTAGHAVEAYFEYRLRHGEAVALGIVAALDLAVRHAGFPEGDRQRCERLMAELGMACRAPERFEPEQVIDRFATDKKVRRRHVRFVVPTKIGSVRWLESPPRADLERALDRIQPE